MPVMQQVHMASDSVPGRQQIKERGANEDKEGKKIVMGNAQHTAACAREKKNGFRCPMCKVRAESDL